MKTYNWHTWTIHKDDKRQRMVTVSRMLIGTAAGLLLFVLDHHILAIAAWILTATITLMLYLWTRGSAALERLFASLGRAFGRGAAVLLLMPLFIVVFPILRILNRLAHRDPLHLRDGEHYTLWLECDKNLRKRKHVSSMFATEAQHGGSSMDLTLLSLF